MKRLSLIALALVACLAIGSASLAVAGPGLTKVKTKVTLAYTSVGPPPYGQSNFHGKVKSKKRVCRKGRKVRVKNVDTGTIFGKAKTNKKGRYFISAGSGAPKGTYVAKVKKKKLKKKGIVCKKAKSAKVTVS